MNDSKLKHLEFIQNIITRLSANSFLIKGWSVTLVSALFALAAEHGNLNFILIAYLPVIVFWGLDGFFLCEEKQYRKLYEEVAAKKDDAIDFNLNTAKFNTGVRGWFSTIFTKTLVPFHGALLSVLLLITLGLVLRRAVRFF